MHDAQGDPAAEYGPVTDYGTKYLIADALGSTRLVVDRSGNTPKCLDYTPFGEEIPQGIGGRGSCYGNIGYPGPPETLTEKFTGRERDAFVDGTATKLDFFDVRYFGAAQGRFASPDDPSFGDPEDPQSWNLFSYGLNNPISFSDPSGHAPRNKHGIDPKNGAFCTVGKAKAPEAPSLLSQLGTLIPAVLTISIQLPSQTVRQPIQSALDWMSLPRDPGCLSATTAGGSSVGAAAGWAGLLAGGVVVVTVPGGFAFGGGAGWLVGMTMCTSGTGQGGSGGGGGGHKYAGKTVAEILKDKKASIKNAPLEPDAPTWQEILTKKWEEIDKAAKAGQPGYDTIRKLLTDGRFNK